jgi:hypothetical protein
MHRIAAAIQILRPRRKVYEFAVTPSTWRLWHPWSGGVWPRCDHPLAIGEEIVEELRVAGRRAKVTWTLKERKVPDYWVLEGSLPGHGTGSLIYRLTQNGRCTLCDRELLYNGVNPLLDRLVVRPQLLWEARESLASLKRLLEGGEEKRARR